MRAVLAREFPTLENSHAHPRPPGRRLGALRAAEADLDPDMVRGLAFAFLVKALARHAVTAWDGIGDTAGKPLPLSPEAVERLMDMDEMAAAFWDRATGPVAAVALEGNG